MKCSTGRYFASAIDQPVKQFFSRSCTRYWMREGGFWHPRSEIDRSISFGRPVPGGLDTLLDERGWILAPSSGDRPVDQFRSTGSWRIGHATGWERVDFGTLVRSSSGRLYTVDRFAGYTCNLKSAFFFINM